MIDLKPLHFDPEWLRTKYVDEELTTVEIGRLVHRDMKSVWSQLKKFGIPTRPRGYYLRRGPQSVNYMLQPGAIDPFLGRRHSAATRAVLRLKASGPKPWIRGRRNGMFNRRGHLAPAYIDGGGYDRRFASGGIVTWRTVRLRIIHQRGRTCQRCGTEANGYREPALHHLIGWAGHPETRFDPTNIVVLCRACHRWVHSDQNTTGAFLGGGDAPVWGEKFRPTSNH